jgi:hypothetical protein
MKASLFSTFIILLFYISSCTNKNSFETASSNHTKDTLNISDNITVADSFEVGKIINHVICKADTKQSYALYIPVNGNKNFLPVIYFFDPHGDGSIPLKKYKALADAYNFILAGSNNSKNGNDWLTAENIWRNLFDDTKKRLMIRADRIYTCGFSGGAKVASYIALQHNEIKGVIAGGAGLPDETNAGNFYFSFTAIAGEGDMNLTDLVALNNEFDKTSTSHRIIFFEGKHEWAPENIMNIAFAGLQFDAMRERIIPKNVTSINEYVLKSKKRFDEYVKTNGLIKAKRECELSISLLNDLTSEINWFKEKDAALIASTAYQQQWKALQNMLITEQNIKATYIQQFQQGDKNYWISTIKDVQTKAKEQSLKGAMYQRLAAYLSLAFYSISNQFINNGHNNEAQYFVELYKVIDPENSEAWYFSALLNARNNNAKATEGDLIMAVKNGFTDKNRMMQQQEFQRLSSQIDFLKIENKIKNEP